MPTKPDLSVAVIARDAGAIIGKCLDSVAGLTDDLVVVIDPRTKDHTARICRDFGARVFYRKFDHYSGQRNYAAARTRHRWLLFLDTDEWAGPDLVSEIRAVDFPTDISAYAISRKNIIFGRVINHTNWDPDGLIRLYDKTLGRWQGQVHEQVVVTNGFVSRLENPIFHLNYSTVGEFVARQDRYSTTEAGEKYAAGQRFCLPEALAVPVWEFFRRYLLHAGFLDGWHGLFLSYLMAVYHFSVRVKLWHLSHPSAG